jgi:hypothetical protein
MAVSAYVLPRNRFYDMPICITFLSLAYYPKVSLYDLHAVCVSVNHPSVLTSEYIINFYETWYVYYETWANLNGVLHKSLPSVFVCLYVYPYHRC